MPAADADLSDDPAHLRVQVIALRAERDAVRAQNDKLQHLIAQFRRALFGPRTETIDRGQLQLSLEDIEISVAAGEPGQQAEVKSADIAHPPRKPAMRNRGALPKHLPRIDVVIEPDDKTCPCCSGPMHVIGEAVSEMLDVVPAQYRVKRIRRPRLGCRACEGAVVEAPAPARPVDGGLPTEALLIAIATMKFAWHVPLYRQEQMLAGQGINLDRSTLALWMGRTAWWLKPLYHLLLGTVMASPRIFCDETPMPVLDPGRGRTRTSQFWALATDDRPWAGPAPPAVAYVYTRDRKGERIAAQLVGFHGVLQVDGYAGYKRLGRSGRPGGAITLAFCLAHARRRFFDVLKATRSPIAADALLRIGMVYAIEAKIRGRSAAERLAVRQAETKPIMDELKTWAMATLKDVSTKSGLGKALRYMLGHWDGLNRLLADGRIEVDNNTVERQMRPISIGRKNALFAGSDAGAESWSIFASLINTAKLHEIDPQTYLTDVLERLVCGRTTINRLAELLPWTWKAAREPQHERIAA